MYPCIYPRHTGMQVPNTYLGLYNRHRTTSQNQMMDPAQTEPFLEGLSEEVSSLLNQSERYVGRQLYLL